MNRAQRRVEWDPEIAIPRYEPEVIEADARRFGGDHDKTSTTSIDVLVVGGVEISSRYRKVDELETMTAIVVLGLSEPGLRWHVKSVQCNSKYSDSYSITVRSKNAALAKQIGSAFEAGAFRVKGGHNGITVEGPDGETSRTSIALGKRRACDERADHRLPGDARRGAASTVAAAGKTDRVQHDR
jgi:hypothetical protein